MTKMATDNSEPEEKEDKDKKAKPEKEKPSDKSQPVEGKITTDEKSGYIATLAAYKAMIKKGVDIADKINRLHIPGKKPYILIVDSLDFCSLDVQLHQVMSQLDFWEKTLGEQIEAIEKILPREKAKGEEKAAAVFPAGIGEVVSSIADIVGYFRVDYDVKGQAINLANAALKAIVAGRLDKDKYSVYLPCFHLLESDKKLEVIDKLNKCIEKKDNLKVKIEELKGYLPTKPEENKKTDIVPKGEKRPSEEEDDGEAEEKKPPSEEEKACKNAEGVIKEFAAFNKAVTSVPEGGGLSPIASAAIRQYLNDIKITHLLYLNVTSGGGEMVIGKGLFQWGNIGYLGGCVLTYILAHRSGEIIAANTIFGYSNVKYRLCGNRLSDFELG